MPDIVGRLRSPRLTPAPGSPAPGEMYYDTGSNTLLWWSGTAWVPSGGGGGSSWISALAAQPVLDVGIAGQVRAGRQLTAADFTVMGLQTPIALWNLSDLTDASGNGRALTNKGAVPFTAGINSAANTAAQFTGSTAQALYRSDTGASDPFRIATGSFGCWTRTAQTSGTQGLVSKVTSAGWAVANICWHLLSSNTYAVLYTSDGTNSPGMNGVANVCDGRWHFVVATIDGSIGRIYVDGVLDASGPAVPAQTGVAGVLNVGSRSADASTSPSDPHFGSIDEAFVTADVLSEDQIRYLYCARVPHTLAKVPVAVSLGVRRQRKGGPFATIDFPTPPLRLYNLSSTADQGSNAVSLTGTLAGSASGADGARNGAAMFSKSSTAILSATDAGLPSGNAPRSYGCWIKVAASPNIKYSSVMGWGSTSGGGLGAMLGFDGSGQLQTVSGADYVSAGPGVFVTDGVWHFVVTVENATAVDGLLRKVYVDGKLAVISLTMNSITLGQGLAIGAALSGSYGLPGTIDGVFICGYALSGPQVAALYAKGSQAMLPSPKDPGAHIEAIDASNVYAIFDTLDSQHQLDLAVGA